MAGKPPIGSNRNDPDSFQGVSPVVLASSCDVLQNNSAIPDSGQLSYPFRKAIVIEEIRWTLRFPSVNENSLFSLGALVSTKLQLGQHYLMRDQVPIWLLSPIMSEDQEQGNDTFLTVGQCYSHYRWRLPKPLYVEAGQVLNSTFFRGNDGFGSINVQVSYVGKTVAPNQPVPSVIAVPYAAPYLTPLGSVYGQSNEAHLFNIFDVPLKIQRMTGRVLSFVSGTTAQMLKAVTPAAGVAGVTMQMDDSWGEKIVQNLTGPSDIFDCLRAAWTVDTVLPGKGMYVCKVWNIPAAQQVHVGMIGYREEAR